MARLIFIKLAILNSIFFAKVLFASQVVSACDSMIVDVFASINEPNIISIQNDRIEHIELPETVKLNSNPISGTVTIELASSEVFVANITSEIGSQYLIRINPIQGRGQEITISGTSKQSQKEFAASEHVDFISFVFRNAFQGLEIDGFNFQTINKEKTVNSNILLLKAKYVSPKYLLNVFEYKNNSSDTKVLTEKQFATTNTIAAAINRKRVAPGDWTRVFVLETNYD